jgi:hypothetical protein
VQVYMCMIISIHTHTHTHTCKCMYTWLRHTITRRTQHKRTQKKLSHHTHTHTHTYKYDSKIVEMSRIDEAFVIGAALSLSSSAFVLKILQEKGQLGEVLGRASLGVLLLQVRTCTCMRHGNIRAHVHVVHLLCVDMCHIFHTPTTTP